MRFFAAAGGAASGIRCSKPVRGVDGALNMTAVNELVDAALLAADTGANVLYAPGVSLRRPVGV